MQLLSKQVSTISHDQLFAFVAKLDHHFNPPLSSRVNLSSYVSKLLEAAEVLVCFDAGEMAGVLAFYNNDLVSKCGYITYLAVDEAHRGKGIAAQLLNACILSCRESGMQTIKVETWETNTPVLNLYKTNGFAVTAMLDDRAGEKSIKLALKL